MNLREATINRDKNVLIDEVRNILVNSYDNAIRYTDFFLDSTINMLQKTERPCLLLYIGDHGENLLDDDRHMLLHGTYSGSAYEFHVPMIVWYSDSYARKYPSEIENLQQNKRSKTSSMTLFATMLQLGHVPYPKLNAAQSLASPTFAPDSIVYGLDANLQVVEIPLK
jgi:glucan phosphoethanolaminetransferase (alkaline phosphatase superfamily)